VTKQLAENVPEVSGDNILLGIMEAIVSLTPPALAPTVGICPNEMSTYSRRKILF